MMTEMKEKGTLFCVAMILVLIGGINWGLVGLLNLDLVALLLGSMPIIQKLVYILVGLSAVFVIFKKFIKK
ncbi:MAG: DUF378 domain-containing protein [Gammaproteobacteria bacterium]|jgi:uncharacterized membrane protein YuzA (DUF378 family)